VTYRRWAAGPEGVLDFLNNAMVIGPFPWAGLPVGGKTLILGGQTITFPGDEDAMVPLTSVIGQLRESIPGLHVDVRAAQNRPEHASSIMKYLSIYHDDGLTFGAAGTANALFNFSADADTRVLAPVPGDNIKSISAKGPSEYEVIAGGRDEDFTSPAAPSPGGPGGAAG
jgi:hypothetical protein